MSLCVGAGTCRSVVLYFVFVVQRIIPSFGRSQNTKNLAMQLKHKAEDDQLSKKVPIVEIDDGQASIGSEQYELSRRAGKGQQSNEEKNDETIHQYPTPIRLSLIVMALSSAVFCTGLVTSPCCGGLSMRSQSLIVESIRMEPSFQSLFPRSPTISRL